MHYFVPKRELGLPTNFYPTLLWLTFCLGVAGAIGQTYSLPLRRWMRRMCPIIRDCRFFNCSVGIRHRLHGMAAASPTSRDRKEGPVTPLASDRALLFDSTWHSLFLLLSGYSIGVVLALITGVTIGWFPHARYWGMPLLKIVGPIPATAWIPLAMVVAPSALCSAVGLVALAVWFPVNNVANRFGHFQHAHFVSRRGTSSCWRRARLPYLSGGDSRCSSEIALSDSSWDLARHF